MPFLRKSLALLRQRCPRCLQGPIYRLWLTMHEQCPVCGMRYEREPGYFIGAMYVSYGMATILIGLIMYLLYLALPDWDLGILVLMATGIFVPFVPMATRYSRVIWMYFDHWAWPSTLSEDNGSVPGDAKK
jgi:uncharacterized protein (DUF983 family)